MQVKIKRLTRALPVTIGTDTPTATAVRMDDAAGVALLVGPLTASATVSIYGGGDQDGGGVFVDAGSLYSLTLATATTSSCYSLPDGLFGAGVIRLVGSAPLTGTVILKT
jgi:hypothetical protein